MNLIGIKYRSYNDDNDNKIMIMVYDIDLKWIKFEPIFIVLLCSNPYSACMGNKCTIISHWFEIIMIHDNLCFNHNFIYSMNIGYLVIKSSYFPCFIDVFLSICILFITLDTKHKCHCHTMLHYCIW